MHPQSFHWADLSLVAALVLLEGLLSGDNALVLAIVARELPGEQQKKALLYGVVGAFVLRFLAILGASLILRLWWIQAIGAVYLLYVAIGHFWKSSEGKKVPKKTPRGFWQTVVAIEMIDFAFAIDSVLAGVAFVGGRMEKIWLVWAGAVIGIVLLRVASGFFIKLLERYPSLDHLAYGIVGWVGIKLVFLAGHSAHEAKAIPLDIPEMSEIVFWAGMGFFCLLGLVTVLKGRSAGSPAGSETGE